MPYHLDNRCTISLMQVESHPYYRCPFCSTSVHPKMSEIYDRLSCLFCDAPLDLVSNLDNNETSIFSKSSKTVDCLLCVLDEIEVKDELDCASHASEDNITEEFELMRVSDEEEVSELDGEEIVESAEKLMGKRKRCVSERASESESAEASHHLNEPSKEVKNVKRKVRLSVKKFDTKDAD